MHIPGTTIHELELLSFADAMARSGHDGSYDVEKWLYGVQ